MKEQNQKNIIPVVSAELYNLNPIRYELRKGSAPGAPPCPYGHQFKWIGYDKEEMKYVRVTKSVFKRMINQLDADMVAQHELEFEEE